MRAGGYFSVVSAISVIGICASCSSSSSNAPAATLADAGPDAAPVADAGADAAMDAMSDAEAGPGVDAGPTCPAGSFANAAGCAPAGIQGCAAMFVEADGLCRPRAAKCPAGTTPKLDVGCVPVGLPTCAPVFVEADGLCHPSQAKCAEGTIAVPSEGCVSLDGPDGCGDAPWGAIPDAPNSVYVDAAAAVGGDGSKAKPFTTIAAAIAAAPSGGRVVLAAGTYAEPIVAKKPLEIRGRCASKVTVSGVYVNGDPVVVYVSSTGVSLRGFTITGAGHGIAATGGAVSASWLAITAATINGVLAASSSQVSLDHVLVRATKLVGGKLGRGIEVEGSKLVMTSSVIVDTHDMGVLAQKGSTAKISSSLIEGTKPSGASYGFGIATASGGTLELTSSAIVANHGAGVAISSPGTSVVTTSFLAGNVPSGTTFGPGLTVNAGGHVSVASTLVAGNSDEGLSAYSAGTTLDVTGCAITGTTHGSEVPYAVGVHGAMAATITLQDTTIAATDGIGVEVAEPMTTLKMTGSVVDGARGATSLDGYALASQQATATLTGNAFFDADNVGVGVSGGTATFTGNLIEGAIGLDSATYLGGGATVGDGAVASFHGDAFVGNRVAGLEIASAGTTVVDQVLVRGTLPSKYTGRYGVGITSAKTDLTVTGSAIEGGAGYGLAVRGAGVVRISGTRVSDVAAGAVDLNGVDTPFGDGVIAVDTVDARLSTMRVERCARAGILFMNAGTDIDDVSSRLNAFGLVLQGATKPHLGGANQLVENGKNVVSDGALAVPPPPNVPTP